LPQLSTGFCEIRRKLVDAPETITLSTWLVVFLFFSLTAKEFTSPHALSNILTFGGLYGIVAIGVAFVMISGEFDLSVGSILAVAGYVFALSLRAGVPPILAVGLVLAVSGLLGVVNGTLVAFSNLPSFIVTLGTLFAYRGVARLLGNGLAVTYTPAERPALFAYLNGYLESVNQMFDYPANFRTSSFWFLGLTIVMTFVLMRTSYGNWVFASGGNPEAAQAQGVNVRRVKLINFGLSGLFAGFAGVTIFCERGSATPLAGTGIELIVITASVIGGIRLSGGQGTIIGAGIGILLLSTLEQGLALMGVPNEIFRALAGLIIILTVITNSYLEKGQ
jgi:simple sugar transport system permease protein